MTNREWDLYSSDLYFLCLFNLYFRNSVHHYSWESAPLSHVIVVELAPLPSSHVITVKSVPPSHVITVKLVPPELINVVKSAPQS